MDPCLLLCSVGVDLDEVICDDEKHGSDAQAVGEICECDVGDHGGYEGLSVVILI